MDLLTIIQRSGLRFDFLAEKLFPENKHPYNALSRVIRKGADLNESQIRTLSDLTGFSPNELLAAPAWAGSNVNGTLELTSGDYKVSYAPTIGIYSLSRNSPAGTEQLGSFSAPLNCTVRQFLQLVEKQIDELT